MNKKLLAVGLAVMLMATGCTAKKDDQTTAQANGDANDTTTEQTAEEENTATDEGKSTEVEFMKPSSDTIDFSKLDYIKGETEPNKIIETIVKDRFFKGVDEYSYSYTYNYTDLNGDDYKDAVVLLVGMEFAGSGGSTALILKGVENGFAPLSTMTLVNAPIIISDEKTSDYKDIILNVSGGGAESSYNVMKFDGKAYPKNPSVAPLVEDGTVVSGQAIIANDDYYKNFININVEMNK